MTIHTIMTYSKTCTGNLATIRQKNLPLMSKLSWNRDRKHQRLTWKRYPFSKNIVDATRPKSYPFSMFFVMSMPTKKYVEWTPRAFGITCSRIYQLHFEFLLGFWLCLEKVYFRCPLFNKSTRYNNASFIVECKQVVPDTGTRTLFCTSIIQRY